MLNYRVVICALAVSALLILSACKSKPDTFSSPRKPNQAQSVSSNHPESSDEQSCRVFVQKFYDWQISQMVGGFCSHSLKGTSATQQAIDIEEEECRVASAYRNAEKLDLKQVLSPRLQHYLDRLEAVQAKEQDAGLDFDPFLNTQDPSPKFVVDSVRINRNRCDAIVHGYDQGEQREEVMPELSKASGHWIIENFHYAIDQNDRRPTANDDLIHMIREYIGEVK